MAEKVNVTQMQQLCIFKKMAQRELMYACLCSRTYLGKGGHYQVLSMAKTKGKNNDKKK